MAYLEQFKVDDISLENSQFTFILESPHTHEIDAGFPAAGETGVWMSKVLFNKDVSLGKLIKINSKSTPRVSILNSSQFPLQKSCYNPLELTGEFLSFLGIKDEYDHDIYKEKVKDKLKSKVGKEALLNFKNRLLNNIASCTQLKIIVFGVIAQCFFEEATQKQGSLTKYKEINWEGNYFSVIYAYHPSPKSGHWKKEKNKAHLRSMIE